MFTFLLGHAFGQGNEPKLRAASAIAFDRAGNLFIADAAGHQVWEATLGGKLVLVAGSGVQGFAGDGGPAVSAQLNEPQGLAFGLDGTLYIADTANQRIRGVNGAGTISTVAGTGASGGGGDGGSALAATLRGPRGLAVDAVGAVLICDAGNHRVRRVSAGVITTVAGSGVEGFSGDGGPALAAELDDPSGVVVTGDGRMFIADTHNQRVRVVDAGGMISTVAGTGVRGWAGDGGAAAKAELWEPRGLAWTSQGELLIADEGNQRVRKVDASGMLSTVAGSGVEGGSPDGAAAAQASMRSPRAVAVSSFGLPVFADALNATARELAAGSVLFQPAALASGRSSSAIAQGDATLAYGQQEAVGVSVTGTVGLPQGQVTVSEGGSELGGAALTGAGASLGVPALPAGSHQLTVAYLGDGLNPAAAPATFSVTVAPLAVAATANPAEVVYGAPAPALSGIVTGLLPQDAGDVTVRFAAAVGSLPDVGTYPISASLTGTKATNYALSMSASSGSLQVVKAGTAVILGQVTAAYAGLPLQLSANVAPATGGTPTGAVQFLDGTTVVAQATLHGGSAAAAYPAPPVGTRELSVQYLGDGNFLPSTSALSAVAVLHIPDFTVTPGSAQSASTPAGGAATYTVLVSSQPGPFNGAVSLSATGLPGSATLTFSPPQVVPGTGSAAVRVFVQTAAPASAKGSAPFGGGQPILAALAMGGLGWAWLRPGRRRALPWLLCGVLLLAGCGARTVGEGTGGVLAQSYTLQVTGTGTNLAGAVVTHSTALTLTVQQ